MSGTPITMTDPTSGYTMSLVVPTLSGNVSVTFPTSSGNLLNTAVNNFTAPIYVVGSGGGTPATLTNLLLQSYDTKNAFIQSNVQNLSNGASASSDWVCTADNGSDSTYYLDRGINSSGYSDANYSIGGANDSFDYCVGGHFATGTATAGKNFVIHTGGTTSGCKRAAFTDTGSSLFLGGSGTTVGLEERMGGVIWTKTNQTSLASFTTAASVLGTGVGTLTIPAGTFIAGRQIHFRAVGSMTDQASVPTMGCKILLGGTTMADTGSMSLFYGSQTYYTEIVGMLSCRQTGSSATVIGEIKWTFGNATYGPFSYQIHGTIQNINTASSNVLDLQAYCNVSNANNKFIIEQAFFEIKG